MISLSLAREDKEVVEEDRTLSAGEMSVETVGVESAVSSLRSEGGEGRDMLVLAMIADAEGLRINIIGFSRAHNR